MYSDFCINSLAGIYTSLHGLLHFSSVRDLIQGIKVLIAVVFI